MGVNHKPKIIDEIERIRKNINVTWRDLFRLAFGESSEEAKRYVRKINREDERLFDIFAKFGD